MSFTAHSPTRRSAAGAAFSRNADGSFRAGDVITAVNGEAVEDFDAMLAQLERYQAGDRVTLTLWRAGSQRQQVVVLGGSSD